MSNNDNEGGGGGDSRIDEFQTNHESGSLIKTFSKLVSDIDAYECEALEREIEAKERKRKELSVKILSMEKHLKSYVKSFRDHIDKIEQTGNAKIAWIRRLEKRKREEIERAVSVLTKRTRFDDNEKKKKKKKSVPLSPPPPPPKSLKSSQEGGNDIKKREKKSPSQMNESSDSTFSDVGMMVGGDFMDEFSMTGDDMNDAASVNADDGLYF